MAEKVDSQFVTPQLTAFTAEHAIVAIVKQPLALSDVERVRQQFRALRERRPHERVGYLCVLEESAGLSLPSEVRNALSQLMRDFDQNLQALVVVFEATGFAAAIVRSVLAAMTVATRNNRPTSVAASVREGVDWLVAKGVPRGHTDLAELVDAMRRRRQPAATAQAR
jgi:hypothetical protein